MISIIIPTLNEEKNISYLLRQLTQLRSSISHEIIVVDGGSQDQTCEVAECYATVYQLKKRTVVRS